mgnify:CR=1 FL=1
MLFRSTIAAVGVAFAKFTAYLVPWFSEDHVVLDLGFRTISAAQLLSIVVIVLLTYINSRGVKNGKPYVVKTHGWLKASIEQAATPMLATAWGLGK